MFCPPTNRAKPPNERVPASDTGKGIREREREGRGEDTSYHNHGGATTPPTEQQVSRTPLAADVKEKNKEKERERRPKPKRERERTGATAADHQATEPPPEKRQHHCRHDVGERTKGE